VWEQVLPPVGYIAPHFHYFEEVLSFLGGVAEVQVGSERRSIGAGTSVLIPVETVHQVRTVGEEPVRVLAFLATIDPLVQYLESPSPVAWEAGDEAWRPPVDSL
jgi:quercetin dioxygenase-like cupin family protein